MSEGMNFHVCSWVGVGCFLFTVNDQTFSFEGMPRRQFNFHPQNASKVYLHGELHLETSKWFLRELASKQFLRGWASNKMRGNECIPETCSGADRRCAPLWFK